MDPDAKIVDGVSGFHEQKFRMKKLVLLITLVGVTSVLSQGQVDFSNMPAGFRDSAVVDRFVYADFIGGTKLSGTQWVAQLYAAPGAGALEASLVPLSDAPLPLPPIQTLPF